MKKGIVVTLTNSFCEASEASVTLIPEPDRQQKKKKNKKINLQRYIPHEYRYKHP